MYKRQALATDVTVLFQTEIFDIGSNFASNTFTAPVTGKYQLNAHIRWDSLNTAHDYVVVTLSLQIMLITSLLIQMGLIQIQLILHKM